MNVSEEEKGGVGNRVPPTLSDLYPDIGRLILFVAFEEADSDSEPSYQQIIFTAEAEAAFLFQCPREGCAGGGFDFAPIIDDLVKAKESRAHGKLSCTGTVGPNSDTCSLQAEYRIIAD